MSFRQRLRQGDLLLGQMVLELFTPGIGPMLASCGLDFVIFDMEHGRCDLALLAEMVASCRGSEIVPIARVPDVAYAPLSRPLDIGARGVMVPRVETRQQAEDIVGQLKYAPQGRRDVALGIAHDLYHAGDAGFFARANDDIAVVQGVYRGTLAGKGWDDFGKEKAILLDAYQPAPLPMPQDWVLVLEAGK